MFDKYIVINFSGIFIVGIRIKVELFFRLRVNFGLVFIVFIG